MLAIPELSLSIRILNRVLGVFDSIGIHPASLSADNLIRTA